MGNLKLGSGISFFFSIISSKKRNSTQKNSKKKSVSLCKMKMWRRNLGYMSMSSLERRGFSVSEYSRIRWSENPMRGRQEYAYTVRHISSSLRWKQTISRHGMKAGKLSLRIVRCSARTAIEPSQESNIYPTLYPTRIFPSFIFTFLISTFLISPELRTCVPPHPHPSNPSNDTYLGIFPVGLCTLVS